MNELECRQVVEQVTAYLERALTPAEEQAFVDHLADCDGCDRYLDQIRRTAQALEALPADALTAESRAALLETFRTRPS
ncbi:anti-sigma factor [Kribbella sp. ALI-6-A]|uniref:anti-sigma factor family protein n=1 Tax=Kribbella sp. ALI-6-A TaxID=1933817 RepID=UPI00097C641A|nr:zf-HC2 domain-containing protein [Kribbella sp. ALI-6-A]ONI73578.1 anti-sigma factor [Kribbella sp. ALI-6-A]